MKMKTIFKNKNNIFTNYHANLKNSSINNNGMDIKSGLGPFLSIKDYHQGVRLGLIILLFNSNNGHLITGNFSLKNKEFL